MKFLGIAVVCLLLLGCGSQTVRNLHKIELGMTTTEVTKIMGPYYAIRRILPFDSLRFAYLYEAQAICSDNHSVYFSIKDSLVETVTDGCAEKDLVGKYP